MICASRVIHVFIFVILMVTPILSEQYYDNSNCSAVEQVPGSNYLCNSERTECDTYVVYRAQENYNTFSSIASIFDTTTSSLLSVNNVSKKDWDTLKPGEEILVPIQCICPDRFSHANVYFNASKVNTSYDVACEVFEGLVKEQSLFDQNPGLNVNLTKMSSIQVPIRCACPEYRDIRNRTKFLVTYPVVENDNINLISSKFGVATDLILFANGLNIFEAIYPQTTLLIPTEKVPSLNRVSHDNTPAPTPRVVVSDTSPRNKTRQRIIFEYIGWVLVGMFILMIISCGGFIFIRKRRSIGDFDPLLEGISLSKFSPHLRDDMSKLKHSLVNFNHEEIEIATDNFSNANVIGSSVYKAKIFTTYLAIERMSTVEEAGHVIDILTKINHINVVKLVGCCYEPTPFLVYEFADHGSLRDCLSNPKKANQLNWKDRVQIAFDLAVGLHYIHHCTKPVYVHRNVNSRNVLITQDLRAKISGFRLAKALIWKEEWEGLTWNEPITVGQKRYLAPEYLSNGQASTKIDVYAFGLVLLELLSASEVKENGKVLKDSISFLSGEALEDSNGCLEKFKRFMDPNLGGDYTVGDAMCMAILALGCLDDDPLHRPTMNDALKAVSRFI